MQREIAQMRLFTSSNVHNLRVWDLTTSKSIARPATIPGSSNGLWFSPDRQHAIFANGTTAQVHELQDGKPVGQVMMHGSDVIQAAFGHDGRQVVTVGRDRVVRVWETLTGQLLAPPLRHPSRVSGVALDRSGERLVTCCDDGTVRVWDLRKRDQAAPPMPFKSDGEILAVSPGGTAVLALGKQGAKIWDVALGIARTGPLTVSKLSRALFSPDGKQLATLDAESLRLWDLTGKQPGGRVLAPSTKVQQMTFSPDGSCVVARLTSDEVRVWDTTGGKEIFTAKYTEIPPWEVPVVSPDGRRIVTLRAKFYGKFKPMWDKDLVKVWDLTTGKVAVPVLKHSADVIQAGYSPDGLRLATASADGTARVWDMKTGEPLTPPLPHTQFLHLIAFSLDGRFLATAGSDGTTRVWDPLTGQPLTPLLRQPDPITALSFNLDNDRLATVSKGGVRLWDLRADGRPVAELVFLTRLLSGLQMHARSGSFVPFEVGNLREQWQNLRTRFPAEFGH